MPCGDGRSLSPDPRCLGRDAAPARHVGPGRDSADVRTQAPGGGCPAIGSLADGVRPGLVSRQTKDDPDLVGRAIVHQRDLRSAPLKDASVELH